MSQYPAPFIQQCQSLLGTGEAEKLLSALQETPPVSLRLHPIKGHDLLNDKAPVPWCTSGRYLSERPVFSLDPLLHAGAYYVQEAGSMFLEKAFEAMKLPEQPLILDLSAAPGGKTTHILSLLNGNGLLISNEPIASRIAPLVENSVKWGYPNQIITQNDPADFVKSGILFDVIVLDAPCSGEGMFRKDPQSVTHWNEQQVQHCALRQNRILDDIWPCLKTGAYLVYSTCTFNRTENEDVLDILVNRNEAAYVPLRTAFSELFDSIDHSHFARFFPHLVKSEGFSLGLVQKTGGPECPQPRPGSKHIPRIKTVASDIPVSSREQFLWFEPYPNTAAIFPQHFMETADRAKNSLRIRNMGTQMYELKGKDTIFSHELAMSIHLDINALTTYPMNITEAQNFLRKTQAPGFDHAQRFVLATYEERSLGWLKKAGNRWNNLYPTDWRLRLQ